MTHPFLSIPPLQVKEKVRKSVYQGDILKHDVHHSTYSRHAQQIGRINQSYRNTVENTSITFKTVKSVKLLLTVSPGDSSLKLQLAVFAGLF